MCVEFLCWQHLVWRVAGSLGKKVPVQISESSFSPNLWAPGKCNSLEVWCRPKEKTGSRVAALFPRKILKNHVPSATASTSWNPSSGPRICRGFFIPSGLEFLTRGWRWSVEKIMCGLLIKSAVQPETDQWLNIAPLALNNMGYSTSHLLLNIFF